MCIRDRYYATDTTFDADGWDTDATTVQDVQVEEGFVQSFRFNESTMTLKACADVTQQQCTDMLGKGFCQDQCLVLAAAQNQILTQRVANSEVQIARLEQEISVWRKELEDARAAGDAARKLLDSIQAEQAFVEASAKHEGIVRTEAAQQTIALKTRLINKKN